MTLNASELYADIYNKNNLTWDQNGPLEGQKFFFNIPLGQIIS